MGGWESWEAFYRSDLQGLYALLVVPLLFLAWLLAGVVPAGAGVEPRAARFVRAWAIVFLIETILDPIVTGPGVRWLGLTGVLADNAMLPFVLLGDLRVFLLVLVVAAPERPLAAVLGEAAAWTLVVPVAAGVTYAGLRAGSEVSSMTLWLIYETAFTALALVLRARLVPARVGPERPAVRAYLRAVLAYVAAYYALWAVADALLLGPGLDQAWALRGMANQLYYGFWVLFAYERFFAPRYAATSRSAHASR